ncbi:MAG TPA: hypothetical protein DCQ50_07585, partial [Chryseobacterium sp.]|nr:hypothetical protein [Chryseobacterium sp.]
ELEKKQHDIQNQIGEYFIKNIKISEFYSWVFESQSAVYDRWRDEKGEYKYAESLFAILSFSLTPKIDQPLTKEVAGKELVSWFDFSCYAELKLSLQEIAEGFFYRYARLEYSPETVDEYLNTTRKFVNIIEMFKHYEGVVNQLLEPSKALA